MSDMHATPSAAVATQDVEFWMKEDHHPANGTLLGFWIYLMSDCLIFACLFATYGVLGRSYAGGPSGADLFDLPLVAVNTTMLLLSSITYGFAVLEMQKNRKGSMMAWLIITGLFGAAFLGILVSAITHTFNYKRDYYIPADVVERTEIARTEELAAHV